MFLLLICVLFSVCSQLVVCLGNEEVVKPRHGFVPMYWDWRFFDMVSPVKNQGNCTAGWAFSVVAGIESNILMRYRVRVTLSEQFLIDCDNSGVGCGSTRVVEALRRIVNDLGGVLFDSEYTPYANEKQACVWDKTKTPLIPVVGYQRVQSHERIMLEHIFLGGPLSAAINSASMKQYKGGIDEPTNELCPADKTDHAVLIVGYNFYVDEKTGKVVAYWIIKNSWGEEWGDRGYYHLVLGRNACGIATDVAFSYLN